MHGQGCRLAAPVIQTVRRRKMFEIAAWGDIADSQIGGRKVHADLSGAEEELDRDRVPGEVSNFVKWEVPGGLEGIAVGG